MNVAFRKNSRESYYDPRIGRFISEDQIGFEGGDTNLYRYVKNGSSNYVDPEGKFLIAPIIAGGLIGGVANAFLAHMAGEDVGRAFLSGFVTGAMTATGGFMGSFIGGAGLDFYKQMMDSRKCDWNWKDTLWAGLQAGILNKVSKTLGVAKGMSLGSQKSLYTLTVSMQSFFSSFIGGFLDISKNTLGL